MESFFLNDKVNSNGIYAVNFYTLGVPHTVIVDDYLPLYKEDSGSFTANAANFGTDGSIWGMVLEKAFAKYHGNYKHIEGGVTEMAVKTLYGAASTTVYHTGMASAKLWKTLSAADKRNDIITTGTWSTKNSVGLTAGHAYTVLGVKELTDTAGKKIKLVKIRNPWGTEGFKGDYSDSSKKWTAALKKQAGAVKKNDGEFFMTVADY